MPNQSELETLCEELGILPSLEEQWLEVDSTSKYKPGEKICFYKTPGQFRQKGFLHYVSNKGNVYIWLDDEETLLPKNTRCCVKCDVYSIEPLQALKKELNRLKIHYGTSHCQLHGDTFLNFTLNGKDYSINI